MGFSLYPDPAVTYTAAAAKALKVSICSQDYITIPGGQSVCSTNPSLGGFTQDKYCGSRLSIIGNLANEPTVNIPICACQTPFTVGIVTDDTADDVDVANAAASWSRGVCLDFKQQPC